MITLVVVLLTIWFLSEAYNEHYRIKKREDRAKRLAARIHAAKTIKYPKYKG